MKVEREFLTIFLNLGPAIELISTKCSRNSRLKINLVPRVFSLAREKALGTRLAQKSTLVHGFTQRDYSLRKNSPFNYTSGEKKIGVN